MKNEAKVSRDSDKFMFRMPSGLREKLKLSAEKNRRSMNAELLVIVESVLTNKNAPAAVTAEAPI